MTKIKNAIISSAIICLLGSSAHSSERQDYTPHTSGYSPLKTMAVALGLFFMPTLVVAPHPTLKPTQAPTLIPTLEPTTALPTYSPTTTFPTTVSPTLSPSTESFKEIFTEFLNISDVEYEKMINKLNRLFQVSKKPTKD